MVIGIDFSINSTAVTIYKDGHFHLFSFVPNYRPQLKAFKVHEELKELITVISYTKAANTGDPIRDQSIKLENADDLSSKIMEILDLHVNGIPDIRIEGYSFGSKGNSFIDLVSYNTFLKAKIFQRWGSCISVIPPKSLKKIYTKNGNASKCDMIRHFIGNSKSPFTDKLLTMNFDLDSDFVIPKPIDDLVDSIALSIIEI